MAINPFFNAELYLSRNPDLIAAGLHTDEQLWNHYVEYGAFESTTDVARSPNSWFDVNYYLSNYPDLIEHGITAATALDHYRNYGVNEGRSFNPNPLLAPDNFDAEGYAAANKDLREAFDITEGTELTDQQKADLLSHFLAYGYAEDRKGVNESFADLVEAVNTIDVDAYFANNPTADSVLGSIADDTFVVNGEVANKTIDGLGGSNTVQLGTEAATGSLAEDSALFLRNVEHIVVQGAAEIQSQRVADIELGAEASGATVQFAADAVAGSDTALNVKTAANGAELTVNGVETVNVAATNAAAALVLNANEASGETMNVNLSGGSKEGFALTFESVASTSLTHLTIDAAKLNGALDLSFGGDQQVLNVKNLMVKGSAAEVDQDFSALAGLITGTAEDGFTVTLEGGAGNDTFEASTAIDSFTGAKGENVFNFTAGNSLVQLADGKITATDTITDFAKDDVLTGVANLSISTATGSVPEGVSLEELATTLESGSVFGLGGDSYVLVTADTDLANVELVKLAGVNLDKLAVNDEGALAYA